MKPDFTSLNTIKSSDVVKETDNEDDVSSPKLLKKLSARSNSKNTLSKDDFADLV